MTTVEEAVTALRSIDLQSLQSEVDNLRAIKTWAMNRLGVDYQPGDRVTIISPEPSEIGGGWEHYREALAPGQTGIAGSITFNQFSKRWQVLVGMDRAWSIHAEGWGDGARTVRHWRGVASEAPAGYELYDKWEQRYPNGQVKHFSMAVEWLAKAPAQTLGGAA